MIVIGMWTFIGTINVGEFSMIQMVVEIDIVYYFHCDALIIYIYIYSICIGYILFVFSFVSVSTQLVVQNDKN